MAIRDWRSVEGRAVRAIHSMHPRWVNTTTFGSRKATQVTDRRRAILELTLPVHVQSHGRYRGLSWKR